MQTPSQHLEYTLRRLVTDDPEYKSFREKTTNLCVLGLRLPILNAFAKASYLTISELNEIWKTSNTHEVMTIALLHLFHRKQTLGKKEWGVIKHWIDRVENWEHSDTLSSLYSHLFEHHPQLILPTLKKWNVSKNPWKQRASIVSLIYYASPKRKAPPVELVLTMVEPLIGSKDKYVNKAIGWTLRESYKLYPKKTFAFLQQHVNRLAADSFSYATEKVTQTEKKVLKQMRARQKKKI